MSDDLDAAVTVIVAGALMAVPDLAEVLKVWAEVEADAARNFGFYAPTSDQEERLRVALGLPQRDRGWTA